MDASPGAASVEAITISRAVKTYHIRMISGAKATHAGDDEEKAHRLAQGDAGRSSAAPYITDFCELASRMAITNAQTLAQYHTMAYGVAAFPKAVLPDSQITLLAKARKPPIYQRLNHATYSIREYLEPAQSWWTDVSNPRHEDTDGCKYARLAVCGVTAYGHLSFSPNKDTASLVAHLEELETLSKQMTGQTPIVYRMDFASEAAAQGRGDNILVAGLKEFLDERPGVRIIPLAPHTQAHNKAENAWGVLLGIALQNHIRACISPLGWSIILRGSLFQYNPATPPSAPPGRKPGR